MSLTFLNEEKKEIRWNTYTIVTYINTKIMKSISTLIVCLLVLTISNLSFSQNNEVKKEVRMEEENGKKVLTIITEVGGIKSAKIYEGLDAEKKMEELKSDVSIEEERQEVKLEDHDGKKTLTISTTKKGKVTKEVYVGSDAEKKMKELGIQEGQMIEVEQVIEKEQ